MNLKTDLVNFCNVFYSSGTYIHLKCKLFTKWKKKIVLISFSQKKEKKIVVYLPTAHHIAHALYFSKNIIGETKEEKKASHIFIFIYDCDVRSLTFFNLNILIFQRFYFSCFSNFLSSWKQKNYLIKTKIKRTLSHNIYRDTLSHSFYLMSKTRFLDDNGLHR